KDINDVASQSDDPAKALRAVVDAAKKIGGPVVMPLAKPDTAATTPCHNGGGTLPPSLAAKAAKKEAADNAPGDAVTVAKHEPEESVLMIADRSYRVRGLSKNTGYEAIKVSLRI